MVRSEWYEKVAGKAEHLVYLDSKAKELEKLFKNEKTMIIRGAAGKKVPLGGRVKIDDVLYFVETGGSCYVVARAIVKNVIETDKMTSEESVLFVDKYEKELNLSKDQYKRWAGKKFLCLVEIDKMEMIEQFKYDRQKNMDDWVITDDISKIAIKD
ncbi:hypothetical protein CVV43_02530 [Candidatus Saccharibacteria bacterium HGW-Saccharibacteria-1]|nr:MAG: hypothetical protein CVV43_02530 [Candidatus Saccharibacteria bacterium HGW-Saccharibacteria-1]